MASKTTTIGLGAALSVALAATVPQIEKFESERHVPYHDIANVLTVCYGHTGTDVVINKVYTSQQCTALATQDATKAANGVLAVSPGLANHPMQLAAAISFSYNVGVGTYDKSSVARDFNAGNLRAGCADLLKYVYAGGKYSNGLANRRNAEYKICMSNLTKAN